MSVLPELEQQLVRAAGGGSPGRRRRRGWASVALAGAVVGLVVLVFAAVGSRRAVPGVAPAPKPAPGPTVPASWAQACSQTGDCEPVPSGSVPSALRRPFRVPALRPGQACPSSPARRFTTSYIGGVGLGNGPVRADIGDRVDVPNGRIVLGTTGVPGWFGIKTVWYSVPAYDGPWSVRAVRLSGHGQIDLGNSPAPLVRGGSAFGATAIVIPPGPTLNTSAGYRTDPRTTWISTPGCYAWQVEGLTFSELIVFQALRPHSLR